MPYQDSDVTGGKVRLKTSMTAGETITADGLVPGEPALTPEQEARVLAYYAADAALYAAA